MTRRQERARKGKEHDVESWQIGAWAHEKDQRTFEAVTDITVDWDAFNKVVEQLIGRALRSAKGGKSGRVTWQSGIITVKVRKGTERYHEKEVDGAQK